MCWRSPGNPGTAGLGLRFKPGPFEFTRQTTSQALDFAGGREMADCARARALPCPACQNSMPEHNPEHTGRHTRQPPQTHRKIEGFPTGPGAQQFVGEAPASRARQCSGLGSTRGPLRLPDKPHLRRWISRGAEKWPTAPEPEHSRARLARTHRQNTPAYTPATPTTPARNTQK